jgi:hypothetical protein
VICIIILEYSTTCITSAPWTRKMPSRPPCPKPKAAKRRPLGREPAATAGHRDHDRDHGAILAGVAVSPSGPQRIILVAQMLHACGIQTADRSQHYVVLEYYSCTTHHLQLRRSALKRNGVEANRRATHVLAQLQQHAAYPGILNLP